MNASFGLDGCHELKIVGDVPRTANDPASVSVSIIRTPLPVIAFDGDIPGTVQAPSETILSFNMRPSHARAVASALLSAATEARNT